MKCNSKCIYYIQMSGTQIIKDETFIKIKCDFYDEFIKNIEDATRHDCPHYLSKEMVSEKFRVK